MNNTGLNHLGPLTHGFFSIANTTVLHNPWNPWMQNLWIQRANYKDFPLCTGVSATNSHVVQGGTVLSPKDMLTSGEMIQRTSVILSKNQTSKLFKGKKGDT